MANLVATALINFERFMAGMKRHVIQIGDHRVVYSEGGKGDTLLLLHGFGAAADSWNPLAGSLTKKYHVIAPDLPGWGASTRHESASYAYPAQIERLYCFTQKLGLDRFHLMGHSMGGFLASDYAARYPEKVITLGLLCPHGMSEPEPSDLSRSIEHGHNWLVASSLEDFNRLLDNIFVKRPSIPRPVIKYLSELAARNSAKSLTIFNEMQQNDPPLIERLAHIKAPTMIVWGDQDRVLHVSCANLFKANIKNAELLILKNCGHMPLSEKVNAWKETYLAFVDKAASKARTGLLLETPATIER